MAEAVSGSDEFVEHFCGPCELGNVWIPADGYCQTCEHYLCNKCYKHHRTPLPTRHHVLLTKDEMPSRNFPPHVIFSNKICLDICEKHSAERLIFYCGFHDSVLCGVCMMKQHRQCEQPQYIPDVSTQAKTEFRSYKTRLDQLSKDLEENVIKSEKHKESVKVAFEQVRTKAAKFKKEIQEYIDKLFRDFEGKVKETEFANKKLIHDGCNNSSIGVKNLQALTEKLEDLHQNSENIKLYVAMKKSKPYLKEIEEKLLRDKEANSVSHFWFEPDQQLAKLCQNVHVLGSLVKFKTQT